MKKTAFVKSNTYSAYTLFELLIVMSILTIFGAMSFGAFNGLQNTVKMNEYMLTLEQDIRSAQRSAMLLQRGTNERWLYGIGIDFSTTESDGTYKKFKWCSQFNDYGAIETKSDFPNYNPNESVSDCTGSQNACLPNPVETEDTDCSFSAFEGEITKLVPVSGNISNISAPKSVITLSTDIGSGLDIQYVLFESVSGKAFFYNSNGALVNYDQDGDPEEGSMSNFTIQIDPMSTGKSHSLTVDNLSGRIRREVL